MKVYSVTDVGQKRKVNQDYVFASEQAVGNLPNLFVVADGMGGHNAGDFASSFAVQVLLDTVKADAEYNPIKIIRKAIENANLKLLEQAAKNEGMSGMGTTMVAVTVVDHYAYVANVGDSRLYVMDDGIRQITKDHSLVEEMVRMGEISREDARNHPDKNIITRAMGVKDEAEADFYEFRIRRGDKILMCTDGLSNMVEDEDMFGIVKGSRDIIEAVHMLIDKANEAGGRDNIGVVMAEPIADEVDIW